MDEKYLYSISRQDLINRIDVALAGRIAEEIIFGYVNDDDDDNYSYFI